MISIMFFFKVRSDPFPHFYFGYCSDQFDNAYPDPRPGPLIGWVMLLNPDTKFLIQIWNFTKTSKCQKQYSVALPSFFCHCIRIRQPPGSGSTISPCVQSWSGSALFTKFGSATIGPITPGPETCQQHHDTFIGSLGGGGGHQKSPFPWIYFFAVLNWKDMVIFFFFDIYR